METSVGLAPDHKRMSTIYGVRKICYIKKGKATVNRKNLTGYENL
jgi:hypothetical protein